MTEIANVELQMLKMVENPDKFHYIIINRLGKLKDLYDLLIDDHKIEN